MKPASDIHVNVEPPIDAKSLTSGATMIVKTIPAAGEWLDSAKPIEIEGKVVHISAGRHDLKFILNYTFCSEKEKWCRFGKDTVSIRVSVGK